jgi:hypothetical protein
MAVPHSCPPLRMSGESGHGTSESTTTLRTLAAPHPLISRMNPANQSLLVGNLQQQSRNRVALLPTESGSRASWCSRATLPICSKISPPLCQMEGIETPVFRVRSPNQKGGFFGVRLWFSPASFVTPGRWHKRVINQSVGGGYDCQ